MIRARRRSIYCSPAEWAEIVERARPEGMSNSAFLIACALAEDAEERRGPSSCASRSSGRAPTSPRSSNPAACGRTTRSSPAAELHQRLRLGTEPHKGGYPGRLRTLPVMQAFLGAAWYMRSGAVAYPASPNCAYGPSVHKSKALPTQTVGHPYPRPRLPWSMIRINRMSQLENTSAPTKRHLMREGKFEFPARGRQRKPNLIVGRFSLREPRKVGECSLS